MQVRLLKIASDGVPLEFNSTSDDITLASFTIQGGGPVLGATGLDLNGQGLTDASSVQVTDPTVGFINQTAGNLIFNNIVGKERSNVFTTAGDILFPVVTDTAGQVDAFRLPQIAGTPSATPTASGEGFVVWDSTNDKMYAWTGSAWQDVASSGNAANVQNTYTAQVSVAAKDVVYVSSANNVSPASAAAVATSYAIGFAANAAAPAASVGVKTDGIISGFTGLTTGSRYYLDATPAGAITTSIPTGTGNTIVQVGYAKSTTDVQIQLLQLGRRA